MPKGIGYEGKRARLRTFKNSVKKSGKIVGFHESYSDKSKIEVSFEGPKSKKKDVSSAYGNATVTKKLADGMKIGDKIEVTTSTKVKHG